MTQAAPVADFLEHRQASLPVKITVIVFWGMVLVGAFASFIQLRNLEENLRQQYALNANHIAYELEQFMEEKRGAPAAPLKELAGKLLAETGALGLTITFGNQTLSLGENRNEYTALVRHIEYRPDDPSITLGNAEIAIYQTPIAQAVVTQRKHILVVIGLVLLGFGLVLQWVLKKVLARPFQDMMQTAQAITEGNVDLRFDEARTDEFGYLAKFMNRALTHVVSHQQELQSALDRARFSESALIAEKERAEVTLYSINDAVFTTDARGNIDYLNPAAETLIGMSLPEVITKPVEQVLKIIDEKTRDNLENPVAICLENNKPVGSREHTVLVRSDGQEIDIALSAAPISGRDNVITGAVIVIHDVGHDRVLARELSYQATHDTLTGLFNRREFERQLQLCLDTIEQDTRGHTMCYLDMDQFKVVNDTCGHIAGDQLLRQFSTLLLGQVRETDLLARLGGDEFGILLKHCTSESAMRLVYALLDKVRSFRFKWNEHSFDIGVSIGVVAITTGMKDVTDIMSAADVACYSAKDAGRNRAHTYDTEDTELVKRHGDMKWVSRLGKAIEENRFLLYCQIISPVSEQSLFRPHYEILVRLLDETGQVIPPAAFIPAAERYNMMSQIDRWVVRATFDLLQNTTLGEKPMVAINLSGQSLTDKGFLAFVIGLFDSTDIEPEQICFEITETAAISNIGKAVRLISILRGMGCTFALDDFGSGLSSFNYLKHLKIDFLKLDGSFVKEMTSSAIDHAMVEATHKIGKSMGIKTIAEFVENNEILRALHVIGVDYAQGYGIARPCPAEDIFMPKIKIADRR